MRYLPRKLEVLAAAAKGGQDTMEAMDDWFNVGPQLRRNPDFVSMSLESLDEITTTRVWLEWKILRQYQAIFNETLGSMPEMSHLVAINTRYIGESALQVGDLCGRSAADRRKTVGVHPRGRVRRRGDGHAPAGR